MQLVKASGVLNATIVLTPKPSFLFNERIYTKLHDENEQLWAIKALQAVALQAFSDIETPWSFASIFFIVNPKFSQKVRGAAREMVHYVLLRLSPEKRQLCTEALISAIEDWLRQVRDREFTSTDREDIGREKGFAGYVSRAHLAGVFEERCRSYLVEGLD